MPDPGAYRCGSVAIVGRPNVGKSTLMNRMLGQKIAIVSPKPETTRQRLLGILTLPKAQILFLDTPGLYRGPKTLLARHQIAAARGALQEADVILLMTEAHAGWTDEDRLIARSLPRQEEPAEPVPGPAALGTSSGRRKEAPATFLAINKVDRLKEKELILPQIVQSKAAHPFREIFPISATGGDNVEPLLAALAAALPEGPAHYPPDQLTDAPARLLAQEIIREKALLFTYEEVPHAVAVQVEEWRRGKPSERDGGPPADEARRGKNSTYIRAFLYVERESQKGILIGRGGELLKRIGQEARREIEQMTGGPVFLDLWVKVAANWRKDPVMLRRFGLG